MNLPQLTDEQQKRITKMERNLYLVMPGAEAPPICVERGPLWGEVDYTPHYEFCHLIAHLIVTNCNSNE